MKFWHSLNNRNTVISILIACVAVAFLLHFYQPNFPCLNSDEAAFGYNAYSLLKTGKDEYGISFPSRFKSFGEYKLPVLGYAMIPSMAAFGLNEFATRLPTTIIGILLPLLFYFVAKELTGRKSIAVVAAVFSCFSPWLQILSRHAHEAVLAYAAIMATVLFALRYQKNGDLKSLSLAVLCNIIALFSHHIAKPFTLFFVVWIIVIWIKERVPLAKLTAPLLLLIVPLVIFGYTEVTQPTNRISNLLFYNNAGFQQSIDELRREHDARFLHNKLTKGVLDVTNNYLTYFSYDFLVKEGDTSNPKFGFIGISPITPVEYLFFFIGLYFLFHLREKHRTLLILLLLAAPLSAALSWQEQSITRALVLSFPLLIIAAIGVTESVIRLRSMRWGMAILLAIAAAQLYFLFFTWDFYFFHYPQKPYVISEWQCGYKDVGAYVKEHYANTDHFYISRSAGQPYIYMLYYLAFPPAQYQQQAQLSAPDQYGFGQVEKFDKFIFSLPEKFSGNNIYIGRPADFANKDITKGTLQKVMYQGQEVFWMYSPLQK